MTNVTPFKPADPANILPRVVTVKEARKLLGNCGKTKIFELIKRGKLRSYLFGSRRLIDVESINQLFDEMLSK
jgi:excisionase family DNA binding protein